MAKQIVEEKNICLLCWLDISCPMFVGGFSETAFLCVNLVSRSKSLRSDEVEAHSYNP